MGGTAVIRLLLRLFNIKDYEVCQSCETLKQQLAFVNDEKRQLTETLLKIVSPKTYETPLVEMNPIVTSSGMFSKRRAALEERDRLEAKIKSEAKYIGQPDDKLKDINSLEQELGIEEKEA